MFGKRLEKGQFSWPLSATPNEEAWMQIQPPVLAMLLDGIEQRNTMKVFLTRPRFHFPRADAVLF